MNAARLFITQPFLFFARRKRKAWGVVYNAITKVPVPLAVVRLFDAKTGKVLQTRVTDRGGRYFFIAQPGDYRLQVQKPQFTFPTDYMKGKKSDALFLDLYHGENLKVSDKDATIAANIPVDPAVKERPSSQIIAKLFKRRALQIISFVSPVLAIISVVITPTALTISLLGAQVLVFGGMAIVSKPKKLKGWGIVYDNKTHDPLQRVIVRVFEPIYGKLLDAQVTDSSGRYSALVGPNIYKVTFNKEGYMQGLLDNIDYRDKKEPTLIKEDVFLKHVDDIKEEEAGQWKEEPI